jgi:hypothetical protein
LGEIRKEKERNFEMRPALRILAYAGCVRGFFVRVGNVGFEFVCENFGLWELRGMNLAWVNFDLLYLGEEKFCNKDNFRSKKLDNFD